MTERVPAEVFSPGEYLSDELEARGWTQSEFADIIGRPAPHVNQIIKGKRGITPEIAKDFAAAFGTSALLWLNLEAAYRLHTDPVPASSAIARRARIRELFPVREMAKRGWIGVSKDAEELENEVMRFFGIQAVDETPRLAHAAKKTGYPDTINGAQLAWLFRVKQVAEAMSCAPYSEHALRDAVSELGTLLLAPEGVQRVPGILADCGVRFVIVEHVPASRIDGVCFWLDGNPRTPVIGMSLRRDKIDNFWFVLRHEIEHVLNKDGRDEAMVDVDAGVVESPDQSNEERLANHAAADFCVPDGEMTNFILRNNPLYFEEKVLNFAQRMHVHPGLVVGQIQKRTGRWNLFHGYLEKVRDLVTPVAMTDGYGQIIPLKP
jgi:HTH-type transcriptional regulator/antitoxin HigA